MVTDKAALEQTGICATKMKAMSLSGHVPLTISACASSRFTGCLEATRLVAVAKESVGYSLLV